MKVGGKEEKKRGERREFPTQVSEGPFHPQKSTYVKQKSFIQISPAICLVKLNHAQVWNRLHCQEVNHKQSSFPFDQCLVPSATQRHNPSHWSQQATPER